MRFPDGLANVIVVGDGLPCPGGRLRAGSEHGQMADFLLGRAVRFQQVGQPLPHRGQRPASVRIIGRAGQVTQRALQTPDPPVIGHDQIDDVVHHAPCLIRSVSRGHPGRRSGLVHAGATPGGLSCDWVEVVTACFHSCSA